MKENKIIDSIATLDLPDETTLHVNASELFCNALDKINHMPEIRKTSAINIACSERAIRTHADGTFEITVPAKMIVSITPLNQ